ncbi:MAG TPA: hypothetical protein VMU87_22995 [Stellaceae bacterium]|nr:hypothetical protein [Stellaceae bacterium]
MRWKGATLALVTLAAVGAGYAYGPVRPAYAACGPGDKIDKSTVASATKKIEAAGYSHVRALKKGCDNVWHGQAMKGSAAVYVALTPKGEVYQEQN